MSGAQTSMDRGSRRVLTLAGVTAVAVLLAIFAVVSSQDQGEPAFKPEAYFPGLGERLPDVVRIEIREPEGVLALERDASGAWIVPAKAGFPADLSAVRGVLEGFRSLERVAPKTRNPAWFAQLGLLDPADPVATAEDAAIAITLFDGAGTALAAVLMGDTDATGDIAGRERFHARGPDETRAWLARGSLPRETGAEGWIDTGILDIDREAIRSVTMMPSDGILYLADRESPAQEDFTLANVPEGRSARSPYIINGVPRAVADISVLDVADADLVAGEEPFATAVFRTFDGLVLTIQQYRVGEDAWLAFNASAEPPYEVVPEAASDAEGEGAVREEPAEDTGRPAPIDVEAGLLVNRINALTQGRVFQVAEYKANQMAKPLEELLEPKADASSDGDDTGGNAAVAVSGEAQP